MTNAKWLRHVPPVLVTLLFLVIMFRSAWLCDDAYISFRVADNFVNGYGLTWNVQERVQAYTHPLWLLLFSAVYSVTREAYYTAIAFSMVLSTSVAAFYAWKMTHSWITATLGVLVLTFSICFVDYSTSGLENPLTHVILAIFLWLYLMRADGNGDQTENPFLLSFLAALAAVNRMDSLILFLPALLYVLYRQRTWGCFWRMAAGSLPVFLWTGFSLFYYGFPFPNTAYAKLNNGMPSSTLAVQGSYYLWNSLKHDPITLATIIGALVVACRQKSPRHICVALGILGYLLYIVKIGGDFMSGRYLTAPLLAAVCLLGSFRWDSIRARRVSTAGIAVLGLFTLGLLIPNAADYGQTPEEIYPDIVAERGICDERAHYYDGTGLLRALQNRDTSFPDFPWVTDGKTMRTILTAERKKTWTIVSCIGFFGYYAGPDAYCVDAFGLADSLLARLPPTRDLFWRIGHFARAIPAHYIETVRSGKNTLQPAGLAEYYDHLALIIRGDLWSWERLAAIWDMNLGRYNNLLEPVQREVSEMPPTSFQLMPTNPTQAIQTCNQAIAVQPADPWLYWCRGKVYGNMNQIALAIRDFDRGLELQPENAQAHNIRGMLYVQRKDTERAMVDFNRAIALRPDIVEPYINRGILYIRLREFDKAVQDFGRVIDLDAGQMEAYWRRGAVYGKQQKMREALADFEQVLSLAPTSSVGYHVIASLLSTVGGMESAYGFTPPVPSHVSLAMGNLAWVLATHPDAEVRNAKKAVLYAELASSVAMDQSARLYDVLAASYAEAGRFSDAVNAAQKAVELANEEDKASLAREIQDRLRGYEAGNAYRVSKPKP